MKIIDISWPISEKMTEYKNRRTISFKAVKEFDRDRARETILSMNLHTGTHVDAPSHFLKNGKTIDDLSLELLCGHARVLDLTACEGVITKKDLAAHTINSDEIVLLKTKNSSCGDDADFNANFVYLEHSGAHHLLSCNVRAVGIDYLGIERNQPEHDTHTTLLMQNVPIIEGLRLAGVQPGLYSFVCLPLALYGLEAAPARAVLIAS